MINSGILRETENAASTRKIQKPVTVEKSRLKAKALGDVRNTLHSRPANFFSPNTPAKIPSKSSNPLKPAAAKNVPSVKKAEKKANNTPVKLQSKALWSTPEFHDYGLLDLHNHGKCEQGDSLLNNYLSAYRLSEEQLQNIVYGVKNSQRPVSVRVWEPCEDIELFDFKEKAEKRFSVSDIISDLTLPEIPSP